MKFCTQKEIPSDFEITNDMIDKVYIRRDRGFILSLCVAFVSGKQDVGAGYHNTANIGEMIIALGELLGLPSEEDADVLKAYQHVPIRVARKIGGYGEPIAENTYIGNFMQDRWIRYIDLIRIGVKKAGAK